MASEGSSADEAKRRRGPESEEEEEGMFQISKKTARTPSKKRQDSEEKLDKLLEGLSLVPAGTFKVWHVIGKFKIMYNFLDPKLSPKVNTTVPATDNYEVTNLINGNFTTRSRGFLAYSTVKPPVDITFELICPINVHYIILWTTLGSQKCTAIDISAKYCNKEFTSIAYSKFNTVGIVFMNCRIYSASNLPSNIDHNFHLSYFKRNSFRSFTTANVIKVCILQTDRSVPCLGKIEIWGKPSKMCSAITVNTIDHLMHASNSSKKPTKDTGPPKLKNIEEWEIPDDFKDSLTFEVMAVPITLPSGNSVDQSTLEKYIANEATYGRPASDPFTSLNFTDSRKPIFNAALKSRIDMFLLLHSSRTETFSIKRTLGSVHSNTEDTKNSKRRVEDNIEGIKRIKFCEEDSNVNLNEDADEKLNKAIQKTINSSSFMSFTEDDDMCDDHEESSCVLCNTNDNLYTISCNHLYCRRCLLDLCKELKCRKCEKPFHRNEAKRFHFNTEKFSTYKT